MKNASLFLLSLLLLCGCSKDTQPDFYYLQTLDFWEFINDDSPGLTFAPAEVNGKDESIRINAEVKKIHQSILSEKGAYEDFKIRIRPLFKDNPVGFVYICISIANTPQESYLINFCEEMLSNQPKQNFLLLYGLYVCLDCSKSNSTFLNDAVAMANKQRLLFPAEKTKQHPDIYDSVERQGRRKQIRPLFE